MSAMGDIVEAVAAETRVRGMGISTTPEQIEVMEHAVLDELIEQAVT